MKLKNGFLLHDVGEEHMMVATGDASKVFNGLVRNNKTAAFICKELMNDTTEEHIVDAMFAVFDAPRERILKDVHNVILQIREAGFLDG